MPQDVTNSEIEQHSDPPVAGGYASQSSSRMSDPEKSLEVIQRHEKLRAQRLDVYTQVQDSYDRLPPHDPQYLEDEGLAWTTNIDFGGLEADIDQSMSPLFNLGMQGRTFVSLEVDGNTNPSTPNDLKVIAEEDRRMVDRWGQFPMEYMQMLFNRKAFGLGIFTFDSPTDWHFSSAHPGNLIYKQGATINLDRLPWVALKVTFDACDLIQKLQYREKSAAAGWNIGAVEKAIRTIAIGAGQKTQFDQWDAQNYVQHALENDVYLVDKAEQNRTQITGYILYVREFAPEDGGDARWSEHYIATVREGNQNQEKPVYLYSGLHKHKNISDVISIFPDNVSQGLMERLRGLGVKKLPYHLLKNRMWGQAIDITWLTSSLLLQGGGGDDTDQAQEINFGPVTMIPDDITIPQQQIRNTGEGLVALMRETDALESRNSHAFGSKQGMPSQKKTLGEARLDFQETTKLELFEIQFHRLWLGRFHRARFRRATSSDLQQHDSGYRDAQEMLKRIRARDVDTSLIKEIDHVGPAVVFGDGNPANQYLALTDIMPFMGQMSTDGRRAFARDVIEARLASCEKADMYLGPDGVVGDRESEQRRTAQLENVGFQSSDAAIVAARTDNHLIHIGEHQQFVASVIQVFQGGGGYSMQEAFNVISRAMSHVGIDENAQIVGGHLAEFAQDGQAIESGAFQEVFRGWTSIVNERRRLGQQLEAQRQQQAEEQLNELRQPSLSVEEQMRVMDAQSKIEREGQLAQAEEERRAEAHRMDMAIKNAELQSKRAAAQNPI